MYSNGQTLVHKKTKKLARLAPNGVHNWYNNSSGSTRFIDEKGYHFFDGLKNYTHVSDELGRPYTKQPAPNCFVDETAKKYLVSAKVLAKMRKERLLTWEQSILERMETGSGSCDVAGKEVLCPFADGSYCVLIKEFFLKRRNAKPLYTKWHKFTKEMVDGPLYFKHTDGKYWLYDHMLSDLVVIQFD